MPELSPRGCRDEIEMRAAGKRGLRLVSHAEGDARALSEVHRSSDSDRELNGRESAILIDVFLCYSAADREIADGIAARLERGAEARIIRDECSGPDTVAKRWDAGLSSSAIVLLLSSDSVPPKVVRADWGDLLRHVEVGETPPVRAIVVSECKYPPLLGRNGIYRWDSGPEMLRDVERWLLSLHPAPARHPFVPAELKGFASVEEESQRLWREVVDQSGVARVGMSSFLKNDS
jgi:hypothetical protein